MNGKVHAPDFLTHLVGFALKVRNLGISDHGLIRELSSPLAGSLYGGEGHSKLYEEPAVYEYILIQPFCICSLETLIITQPHYRICLGNYIVVSARPRNKFTDGHYIPEPVHLTLFHERRFRRGSCTNEPSRGVECAVESVRRLEAIYKGSERCQI